MMQQTDYAQHKALYLTCFPEDSDADAEFLFRAVLSKAECVSEYDGNRLVSMLFLMENDLCIGRKTLPFYYLYAACTAPAYRGRGIMGSLLKKAQELAIQKKRGGIFLKPANRSLFAFYAGSDFRPFFKINRIELTAETFLQQYAAWKQSQTAPDDLAPSVKEISLESWYSERQALLPQLTDCYAAFRESLFIAAADGCRVITDQAGNYAVYERRGDLLLIKEALFAPGCAGGILDLAATLIKSQPQKRLEIRAPLCRDDVILSSFGFKETDFSVIWDAGLSNPLTAKRPYHGLAFD